MKRLEGKVAIVTGGNSGIGLATAKRLQEEGARVAISGRNKETLDEAVRTIGDGVVAVQADVAKLGEVDKLYTEVSQKLGNLCTGCEVGGRLASWGERRLDLGGWTRVQREPAVPDALWAVSGDTTPQRWTAICGARQTDCSTHTG